MAGVDEDGRLRAQQLEAAGRGAGDQGLEEGVLGKGAAEVGLGQRDGAGHVGGLVVGLQAGELRVEGTRGVDGELERGAQAVRPLGHAEAGLRQAGVLARDAGVHLAGHVDAVERAHEGGRDAGRMALLEEDVLHAGGRGAADAQDAGAAGLDDGGLLARDGLQGVAEDARVVKADAGDSHAANGLHGRGGVPAAAHAALQNGDVDAGLGKDHGGGHG